MISGASRAIQDVIDQRTVEEEDRLQQLSYRGKATMFQSIEDVQLMAHDPLYEEAEGADTMDGGLTTARKDGGA